MLTSSRIRCLGVLLMLAVPVTAVRAQLSGTAKWADSARVLIDSAANAGNATALDDVIALLDRVLTVTPDDPLLLHYKGYALFRQGGFLMGANRMKDARQVLEAADRTLEVSARTLPWPETYALRAAALGQIIGASSNSPRTAMRNGKKSATLMDRALELGPDNPRVWVLKGSNELHTPRMFGGGARKAEKSLLRARALSATDRPDRPRPAWGQIDLHLWLGQVYAALGRREDARAEYLGVLTLAPNHGWVKYQLLPQLDR